MYKQPLMSEVSLSSDDFVLRTSGLSQLKATVECTRRIHALISLYQELLGRADAVEKKITKLT